MEGVELLVGAWPDQLGSSNAVQFGPMSANGGIDIELFSLLPGINSSTNPTPLSTALRVYPFTMQDRFQPLTASFQMGTVDGGTTRFSILDETGRNLCDTGVFNTTTFANNYVTLSFTTTPLLGPGAYYLGWDNPSASGIYWSLATTTASKMRALGCRASASGLGSTNTLIAYPDAMSFPFVVLAGMVGV